MSTQGERWRSTDGEHGAVVGANREIAPKAVTRSLDGGRVQRSDRQIGLAATEVGQAAVAFEARWTNAALRRVDPDLADRLNRQIAIWYDALPSGDEERIVKIARNLVRGYRLCSEAMERAGAPDDAYCFGQTRDGRIVSFGSASAAQRVAERFPDQKIPHFTFDEAAELLSREKSICAVKALFPGAEVTDVRKGETV